MVNPSRVAITVWEGRVSPVFDVSREAVILTVEDMAVTDRCQVSIQAPTPRLKLDRIAALRVQTLICGAISEPLHRELTAVGVNVQSFVAGEIDQVIGSFVTGNLPSQVLTMPGCRGQQNRFRHRRGRRHGKANRCRLGGRA